MGSSPPYADTLAVLDRVGRALSDGTRRRILLRLADAPAYPADLADHLGASRPAVSNHLACLRDCGLVTSRPAGRFAFYQLSHPRIDRLLRLADEILASPGITLDHPPSQRVPEH